MDTLYIVKEFWDSISPELDEVAYEEAYDITCFRKEELAMQFAKDMYQEYYKEEGFQGIGVYKTSIDPLNNLLKLEWNKEKEVTQV